MLTGAAASSVPGGAANAQTGVAGSSPPLPAVRQPASPAASERSEPPLTDVEQRLGPYTLAAGRDFFVVIHSRRLEEQPGKFEEAATWVEIRDTTGALQFRENFEYSVSGGAFNDQCSVGAQMLAGSNGKGIQIDSECEPSAPLSGGSLQIFGLINGKLAAFCKPLYYEGQTETFVPGAITKEERLTRMGPDMLNFTVFTGNVFVVVPVRVNWMEGKLELGMRCYEQSGHGAVESGCEVPVVDAHPVSTGPEMTFVRMFPEANEQMMPAHVVIRPNSKVEILAAKVRANLGGDQNNMALGVDEGVWLKIRVDGKEGWIHTQEDFEAIGLPQSG